MPKIPEISVESQMEDTFRSIPIGIFEMNPTPKFVIPRWTNRFIALLFSSILQLCMELARFDPKCYSIFPRVDHWSRFI